MPILKIKVCDANAVPMSGQAVKVKGCGQLLTGVDGRAQFLTESNTIVLIEIGGVQVWSGSADSLSKEETFSQSTSGFARAT